LVPPRAAARPAEAPPAREWPAHSLTAFVLFYAVLALVGAAAFPIAFLLFPRLSDRGFGFARVLGMVLATYFLTLAVRFHAASTGRGPALLALGALLAAGAVALAARRREIAAFLRENRRRLWISEAVFAFGFLFFLAFRIFAPEIWWGEKP